MPHSAPHIRQPPPGSKNPFNRRRISKLPRQAGGSGTSGGTMKLSTVPAPPAKKNDSQKSLLILLVLFNITNKNPQRGSTAARQKYPKNVPLTHSHTHTPTHPHTPSLTPRLQL